jgi:hypothetical protein
LANITSTLLWDSQTHNGTRLSGASNAFMRQTPRLSVCMRGKYAERWMISSLAGGSILLPVWDSSNDLLIA